MKYIVNLILILTLFTNTASATILLPSYNLLQTLNDFSTEESKGFQFSTGFGVSTNAGESAVSPKGSTTIGLTSKGQEKEQITKATIGNGSIVVQNKVNGKDIAAENSNQPLTTAHLPLKGEGDFIPNSSSNLDNLLSGLNRDVNNSQEITKDMITGALDGSMTIDNRVLSLLVGDTSGVKSIAKDFKNFGKNLGQIYKNITKNNIIVQSVKNAYTDKTKNIIDTLRDYINDTNKIDQIRQNQKTINKLNGLTNLDAEGVKNTMQDVADIASQDGGFNGDINLYNIDGETKGYAYSDGKGNNIIGFNTTTNDLTNSDQVINTLFHETTNQEQHDRNEQTALNRGNTAEAIWNMANYGSVNTNNMTSQQWNQKNANSVVLIQGNNSRIDNYANYYQENVKNGNKNVKLDELTVFVHGTFSDPKTFTPEFKEAIKRLTRDEKQTDFQWSGDNTKEARAEAANELLNLIKNYEFGENEALYLVGHSNGGNTIKKYSTSVDGKIVGANGTTPSFTAAYLFATPNRKDYIMKEGVFDKYYNIYNKNDILTQDVVGGTDFIFGNIPNIFKAKNPSQITNEAGAINIQINAPDNTYKYTDDDFNNILKPNGGTFENYFNLFYDMSKGQIENHTEMKTPEAVNEIYNYEAKKYNENLKRINENLKKYENFMNQIRK